MQDNFMQTQAQPFVKLAQANMELLTRYSTSSRVMAPNSANATQWFQQAGESTMKLMQSGAFADLMQGMLKNYTEFLAELGEGSMALMSQAQSSLTHPRLPASTEGDAKEESRARHTRRAA
jgi:hypothetical protein